jgi:hypothetical protein
VDDGEHFSWRQENTFFRYPLFAGENPNIFTPTGYQLYKGFTGDRYENSSAPSVGIIYFRYGEALLIYAEAKAELGEINQNDVNRTINALRKRAGMPDEAMLNLGNITPDPNWLHPSLSAIINEVRRERMVELCCEGFRHDDIYRWAAADELLRSYVPKGAVWEQWRDYPDMQENHATGWAGYPKDDDGYIYSFFGTAVATSGYNFNLGRDYLSPLPTDQLNYNPKLGQNPGW